MKNGSVNIDMDTNVDLMGSTVATINKSSMIATNEKRKIYLAHPYKFKDNIGVFIITEELEKRWYHVINPFTSEKELMWKWGVDNYYPDPPFDMAFDMWCKDLEQIRLSDAILVWVPKGERLSGGCGTELAYADKLGLMIYVISESRHPVFAYYKAMDHHRVKIYDSIADFKNRKEAFWI